MSNHIRWLYAQLDDWTRRGLLTAEQSDVIRQRYPLPQSTVPWGTICFSGMGAVVIGLGVILLGAYNWHAIPKIGKLAITFGMLIAAHAGGLWWFAKPDWRRHMGETLCVLGTMLFGAGIWLTAQIYHIDEHFPNGFLIWAIGALAMGWALPSLAQGLLATVLLTIWGCMEAWGFHVAVHWSPVVIFVGAGGLAWRLRSQLLWVFVTAGLYITLLANTSNVADFLVTPVLLHTSTMLVAVGMLVRRAGWLPGSDRVWTFCGWFGSLTAVFLLGFPDLVDDLLGWQLRRAALTSAMAIYVWLPFVLAMVAWGVVAVSCLPNLPGERRRMGCPFENWLLPLSAAVVQLWTVGEMAAPGWSSAWPFTLVFLTVAMMWMARGCRKGVMSQMVIGSLMLVALTGARYFDLFQNLAARGLAFLIVGSILFAEGFYYRRVRHEAKAEIRL